MSFIADIDRTNPGDTDFAGNGDDEIRLLKAQVQDSFPAIDGGTGSTGVTLTTDEVNALPGRVSALESAPGYAPPIGVIMMWTGGSDGLQPIPTGWAYCNGDVVNGFQTPNMVTRLPMDGGLAGPNVTGGGTEYTTESAGNHSHAVTVGDTALSAAQIPAHQHKTTIPVRDETWLTEYGDEAYGGANHERHPGNSTEFAGNRRAYTDSVGSGATHTHSGSSAANGSHTHDLEDVLPPFYTVQFIVYVGVAA